MSKIILGISAYYHDSAATIIKDGKIIAASSEERFTRKKADKSFPHNAINFCLNTMNISLNDVDYIVFYENETLKFERILVSIANMVPKSITHFVKGTKDFVFNQLFMENKILNELGLKGKNKKRIYFTTHHLSHAASAFYPSNFDEAAILTIDGVGEWQTCTIGYGKNNKIILKEELNYPNSLGLLYSAFTYFTGFRVNSGEYKMMGLAPYGTDKYVDLIKEHLIKINDDGSFVLNQKYFNFTKGLTMTNKKFAQLFNCKPRKPNDKITQVYLDMACSIQTVTNEIITKMGMHIMEKYKTNNLCVAGGVALNVVAMSCLEKLGFNLWIQPASSDAGGSLGTALYFYYNYLNEERIVLKSDSMNSAYLGLEIKEEDLKDDEILNNMGATYKKYDSKKLAIKVANLIARGNVVAIARGRAEFGPRALGNRSILASAIDPKMQSKLNLKVKKRESFRPFAPIVLQKDASKYFDMNNDSIYMLKTYEVKKNLRIKNKIIKSDNLIKIINQKRSVIPAVTHVDYTSRVQCIYKKRNPFIYDVLEEYKKITGFSVLVNTSFNVRGEPIVNDAMDAYNCFMNTDIDYLVIGGRLFDKRKQNSKIKKVKYDED